MNTEGVKVMLLFISIIAVGILAVVALLVAVLWVLLEVKRDEEIRTHGKDNTDI